MMEEKDETIIEGYSEEDVKENIETVDDLMKEKEDNKFIARENTAQTQIFIQTANFDGKADVKQVLDLVNATVGNDKKYDLKKTGGLYRIFGTCKTREYIALAIVLSVFEIVPIGDYH